MSQNKVGLGDDSDGSLCTRKNGFLFDKCLIFWFRGLHLGLRDKML
jgi:hypothetical protein